MVVNFVCQPRVTADEYLLECTIKLQLQVKTMASSRSPIILLNEYLHALSM